MARTQAVAGPSGSRAAKPYERPSTRSKGKLPATAASAAAGVNQGAPSQAAQTSRKGKKAWRKNIDITSEEVALEAAREEERITGGKAAEKPNGQLFTIDTVGDVEVKTKMRRAHKPLRSLAILNERSAVPSLTARVKATAAPAKRDAQKLSSAQKDRMRRIARRNVIGEDGSGLGSADVGLAGSSGSLRDAWDASLEPAPPTFEGDFGVEGVVKVKPHAPITLQRQREIREEQIQARKGEEVPEAGVSYNPSQAAHEALLKLAIEEEMGKLTKEERDARRVELFNQTITIRPTVPGAEYFDGMMVGPGAPGDAAEEDDEAGEAGDAPVKKPTKRKTQAQRNKAARRLAKAQEEAHARHLAKLHKSVASAQELKRKEEARLKKLAADDEARKLMKAEKEKMGLVGGEKIGKYRVPKGSVDVQLGEDLSETLRQLKPEGNLFKDRYLALQKKALIEPRVKQMPKRRAGKTKEYEKHAWKRFE